MTTEHQAYIHKAHAASVYTVACACGWAGAEETQRHRAEANHAMHVRDTEERLDAEIAGLRREIERLKRDHKAAVAARIEVEEQNLIYRIAHRHITDALTAAGLAGLIDPTGAGR